MPTQRTAYKYHVKRGNKILHRDITNDLVGRQNEHKQEYGDDVHIMMVGARTTQEAALKWKTEQRKKGKPTSP